MYFLQLYLNIRLEYLVTFDNYGKEKIGYLRKILNKIIVNCDVIACAKVQKEVQLM